MQFAYHYEKHLPTSFNPFQQWGIIVHYSIDDNCFDREAPMEKLIKQIIKSQLYLGGS